MESHIEDVGNINNGIYLLFFEVNTLSISIVIGPTQQGTPSLPAPILVDDFLTDIFVLFVESHLADLGDTIDDIYLLFDEEDPSLIITKAHFDPLIYSLHDHYSQVDMIVDSYVQ